MRDTERQRVYTAEEGAFSGTLYYESVPWPEVQPLADALFNDPWWVEVTGGLVPKVVKTRSDSTLSRASGYRGEIRIAPGHGSWSVLTHEAAHLLVYQHCLGVASHGPQFRIAHLHVATRALGQSGADKLRVAYGDAGLSLGEPSWKVPTAHHVAHGIAELVDLQMLGGSHV